MSACVDLTGRQFGRLTVLEKTDQRRNGKNVVWKCQCICGNMTFVTSGCLNSRQSTSCGCYNRERIRETQFVDLKGQQFGRLTVLEKTDQRRGGSVVWTCRCLCGTVKDISAHELRSGDSRSCGCYQRDRASETFTTHGMSRTPEYSIWVVMHQRTSNTNDKDYHHYGGRGIEVCERWNSFENFLADMGPRPGSEYTLEREDNNRGYDPGNCRWATHQEQCNNRRNNVFITHNGKTQTISQWARELGVSPQTLRYRLVIRKLSMEQIFRFCDKKAA